MSHVGPTDPVDVRLAGRRSVADLLWVANTRHGPGGHWFARVSEDAEDHDHLRDPDDAVDYLVRHGVNVPRGQPTRGDLDRLAAVRDATRALASPDGGSDRLGALVAGGRYALSADGSIGATGRGWRAFADDLVPPLLSLQRSGQVRACGNPYCRLVFVDASRSRTRQWCDTAGCGNRARVARHRRRARPAT